MGQYLESRIKETPFEPDYGRVLVAAGAGAAGAGLVSAGNRLFQGATLIARSGRVAVGAGTEIASNAGQNLINGDDVTLRGVVVAGAFGGVSAGAGDLAANAYLRSPAATRAAQESGRLRRIADNRLEEGLPRPSRAQARIDRADALDEATARSAALRSETTAGSIAFTGGVVNRDGYYTTGPTTQSLQGFVNEQAFAPYSGFVVEWFSPRRTK